MLNFFIALGGMERRLGIDAPVKHTPGKGNRQCQDGKHCHQPASAKEAPFSHLFSSN
jgi:hypothetical protein